MYGSTIIKVYTFHIRAIIKLLFTSELSIQWYLSLCSTFNVICEEERHQLTFEYVSLNFRLSYTFCWLIYLNNACLAITTAVEGA